jgi:hypothetical protein
MTTQILSDRRKLLFIMVLCITVGAWILTLTSWSDALAPAAIGGLLLGLGNNVFANMIKNIGLLGTGVTNESDPATRNPIPPVVESSKPDVEPKQ